MIACAPGVRLPGVPCAAAIPCIGLDFGLGSARLLEVLDVELLVTTHRSHRRQRPYGRRWSERDRQPSDNGEHVRSHHRRVPGDGRAPVVTDDRRCLGTEGRHETDVVGNQANHAIVVDRQRLRRAAVAAHVDGHGAVPGRGERGDLVSPRVPRLGKAMDEQHQRAGTGFDAMDAVIADAHDM